VTSGEVTFWHFLGNGTNGLGVGAHRDRIHGWVGLMINRARERVWTGLTLYTTPFNFIFSHLQFSADGINIISNESKA
jgi:hypothetical protein